MSVFMWRSDQWHPRFPLDANRLKKTSGWPANRSSSHQSDQPTSRLALRWATFA